MNTSGTVDYVLMWAMPNGSQAKKGEVSYTFQILVMDIVRKDKSNLVDVLNDTHLIALDILAELYINGQSGVFPLHLRQNDTALTDFYDERFDEEVAGWTIDVTLWSAWDWDQCGIPLRSSYTSEATDVPTFGELFIDQTPATSQYGTLSGSVNNTNILFSVSQGRYRHGRLQVYLNGQLLQGSQWTETSTSAGTFTFSTAPFTGDTITAIYQVI